MGNLDPAQADLEIDGTGLVVAHGFSNMLSWANESVKLIQQARNEAHRFAINFHRTKRSQHFLDSELSKIKGVGEKSVEKLLKAFGSVEQIRKQPEEKISAVTSSSIAKRVVEYFKIGEVIEEGDQKYEE